MGTVRWRSTRIELDSEGRSVAYTLPDGSRWQHRLEDETGDLLAVDGPEGLSWQIEPDARGNPLAITAPGGGITRYAYDDAQLPDRPTRITDPDGGERSLQWNRLGQLVRHTDCSGHATEYAYDREGRLIRETNALSQLTRYGWDGERIGCEQTHATTTAVLYEPGSFVPLLRIAQPTPQPEAGELAAFLAQHGQARIEPDTPAQAQIGLYLTDHLGTPLRLLDPQGQTLWQAEPDDWGATTHATGIRQPIRFQGQWDDEESGLYYNRYRHYDPGMGRYVTQDPIGIEGDANAYIYPINPLHGVDPLGLQEVFAFRLQPRLPVERRTHRRTRPGLVDPGRRPYPGSE